MQRQSIDNGGWFDLDRATEFREGRRHDGCNFISLATGSQWEHEVLYRTAKGAWVLNHWSQWEGSLESWEKVSAERAAEWLIANGRALPAELQVAGEAQER